MGRGRELDRAAAHLLLIADTNSLGAVRRVGLLPIAEATQQQAGPGDRARNPGLFVHFMRLRDIQKVAADPNVPSADHQLERVE